MLENWVAVVAELERDAAELGEAAQLIRRRYLRDVVDLPVGVPATEPFFRIRTEPPIIMPPAPALHGGRRGGKQQAQRRVKRPQRLPGSVVNGHEDRASAILELVKRKGPMATGPIAEVLKVRDTTVKGVLARMLKSRELVRIGTGPRNWQWQLPGAKATARTLADVVEKARRAPSSLDVVEARDAAIVGQLRKAPTSTEDLLAIMPLERDQTDEHRATDLRNALTRLGYKKIIHRAADGVRWTVAPK